jgi:uncharacterized protein YlxW (UPF0749 family)
MAFTLRKAEAALDEVGGERLTHAEAAKVLGVSRVRVTQLVSAGRITDLTRESIEAYKPKHRERNEQLKEERRAYKQRIRAIREAERQELLEAINRVDRHLMMLAAALGAKGIADTILR